MFRINIFDTSLYEEDSNVTLTIFKDFKVTEDYISFTSGPYHKQHKVYYFHDVENPTYQNTFFTPYGTKLNATIMSVDEISNFYNNPNSFDYENYMLSKKIQYQVVITDIQKVDHKKRPRYFLQNLRFNLILKNEFKYENNGSYINALALGHRDFDDDIYDAYSSIGIIHLLTISGAHLNLIIKFISILLVFLNIKTKNQKFILLFFICTYFFLAGSAIPIFRASILKIKNIFFNNKFSNLETNLSLFLFLFFINPFLIFSLSYILTFIIAIFISYFNFEEIKSSNYFVNLILFSFCVSTVIFPIIVNINYEFNFFTYFFNVLYTPIICFIMLPLSFILTILPNSFLLNNVYSIFVWICETVAIFGENFSITIGYLDWYFFILYYFILYTIFCQKKYHLFNLIISIFILCSLNINIFGTITFLDIGQGNSTYIQLPLNQGTFLIDTSHYDHYDELYDYLKYEGVTTVDGVFISHWHEDHFQNIYYLIDDFNINYIFAPNDLNQPNDLTNVIYLENESNITFGRYTFEIYTYESYDENDSSLVIRIKLGDKYFLFPGDIESDAENFYVSSDYDLSSDILLAPHHGSNTSSSQEFIELTNPSLVVFSAGENNLYNHPSEEVITRYEINNISTHTTYIDGSLSFNFIGPFFW